MAEFVQAGERTYYIHTGTLMGCYIGLYRLNDTEVCLIDTGDGDRAAMEIQEILDQNGWSLKFIINTHTHIDHVGGNRFLMEKWACPAYATEIAKVFAEYKSLEATLMFGGYPGKELSRIFDHPGSIGFVDIASVQLPEGFEYIPLEGHGFGMIGVKTPDQIWFVGDSVLSSLSLEKYRFGYLVDVQGYLNNLDTLETLEGALFIPAHGDVTSDIRPLVQGNRENVKAIIDGLLAACKKERQSFDALLKLVFDHYNITGNIVQYAVMGMTLRCYISYLQDQQQLKGVFDGNILYWTAV